MIDRPDWWRKNQALRDQLDLPEYEAPRFDDGEYTYHIINKLERRYNCRLQFVGYNTEYPDNWLVEADDNPLFQIGRHRNSKGNTIYEMDAKEFERKIDTNLSTGDADKQ